MGPFVVLCTLVEGVFGWSFVREVVRWLNPRAHSWNLALVIGVAIGIMALLGEMSGEGGGAVPLGRMALVATIFIGVEVVAVLLGYALLARPLGLFRHDPA